MKFFSHLCLKYYFVMLVPWNETERMKKKRNVWRRLKKRRRTMRITKMTKKAFTLCRSKWRSTGQRSPPPRSPPATSLNYFYFVFVCFLSFSLVLSSKNCARLVLVFFFVPVAKWQMSTSQQINSVMKTENNVENSKNLPENKGASTEEKQSHWSLERNIKARWEQHSSKKATCAVVWWI